ncbi:MAG: hypothetical protein V7682_03425 [Cycloclasticus sp.]
MTIQRIGKSTLLAIALTLSIIASAQAAKPEGVAKEDKAEHSESFWDRWFGREERQQSRMDADDDVKEKDKDKDKDKDRDREEERESYKEKSSKSKDKSSKHKEKSDRVFNDSERSRIEDYYREESRGKHKDKGGKHKNGKNKQKNLPYGLQKKLQRGGQLPPGWQTKVARGEVLDDEILRHSERLPDDLVRRLPVLRDGTEIRRVGDKVVRVMEGNGTVLDVIDLADVILR